MPWSYAWYWYSSPSLDHRQCLCLTDVFQLRLSGGRKTLVVWSSQKKWDVCASLKRHKWSKVFSNVFPILFGNVRERKHRKNVDVFCCQVRFLLAVSMQHFFTEFSLRWFLEVLAGGKVHINTFFGRFLQDCSNTQGSWGFWCKEDFVSVVLMWNPAARWVWAVNPLNDGRMLFRQKVIPVGLTRVSTLTYESTMIHSWRSLVTRKIYANLKSIMESKTYWVIKSWSHNEQCETT